MDRKGYKNAQCLFDAYFDGPLPEELEEMIREWYIRYGDLPERDKAFRELFDKRVNTDRYPPQWVYEKCAEVKKALGLPPPRFFEGTTAEKKDKKHIRPLWRSGRGRVAAVLIPFLLVSGGLWIWGDRARNSVEKDSFRNTVTVSATGDDSQSRQLEDGSVVWLADGSMLTHDEGFGPERKIRMAGQVYFDVAGDPGKPFVVHTGDLEVRVTGTEFNVREFPESGRIEVSLYEGIVNVSTAFQTMEMHPGQQLVYDPSDKSMELRPVPFGEADWRKKAPDLEFATLDEIFRAMEPYYRVAIDDRRLVRTGEKYSVKFISGETADQAMFILRTITGRFRYEIKEEENLILILDE